MIHGSLIEVKPGIAFQRQRLEQMLPDVETMLFFGKLYELTADQLSQLLYALKGESDVMTALLGSGHEHSNELQDYILEMGWGELIEHGLIDLTDTPPKGEILPQVWESLEIQVADSIKQVLDKIGTTVGLLPGKQGEMLFKSMMTINAKRPVIGDYKATIHHGPQKPNLLVFDVSGSMGESTVKLTVGEVVALAYMANMHLAIVSYTTTVWGPGEFSVEEVLKAAEYGGTHYETLVPLFDRDWGVVVSLADYDSSPAAKEAFKEATGSIDQVLDISLVSRPTYLSEVLGTIASEVRPLLVASNNYSCMG